MFLSNFFQVSAPPSFSKSCVRYWLETPKILRGFAPHITDNRSLFVATRVKKQTKNKVKDLTRKLGKRNRYTKFEKEIRYTIKIIR